MNPSFVTISVLRRSVAVAVMAAGALLGTSCSPYPPYPPPGPGFQPDGPHRFGYGGTNSPNYEPPRALPGNPGGQREIRRDPNNENVNIEPPPPRNNPLPPAEATPNNPPSDPPVTDSPPPPKPKPSSLDDLPYGIPVVGKKGYVYSPYAEARGQVDVQDLKRGTRVRCPYTDKHFRVP